MSPIHLLAAGMRGPYADETLKPLKNVVSALFRLENSRDPEVIMEIVSSLLKWLSVPEQSKFETDFYGLV